MTNELYEVKVINANKNRKYLVIASSSQEAVHFVFTKELNNNLYDLDDFLYKIEADVVDLDYFPSPTFLS